MTGNVKLKQKKLNILAKTFKREPTIPKTIILVPTAETLKKAWVAKIISHITRIVAVPLAVYVTIVIVVEVFHPSPLKGVLLFSLSFIGVCTGVGLAFKSEKAREMSFRVNAEKFYRTFLQREAKILNADGTLSPTRGDKWTITRHYINPSAFTSFQDLDIYYDEDYEHKRFAYTERKEGTQ